MDSFNKKVVKMLMFLKHKYVFFLFLFYIHMRLVKDNGDILPENVKRFLDFSMHLEHDT